MPTEEPPLIAWYCLGLQAAGYTRTLTSEDGLYESTVITFPWGPTSPGVVNSVRSIGNWELLRNVTRTCFFGDRRVRRRWPPTLSNIRCTRGIRITGKTTAVDIEAVFARIFLVQYLCLDVSDNQEGGLGSGWIGAIGFERE